MGASIVAAGTTVAGLGAAAIKVGIEFESAFAGVKMVDASDEQLSALHDGLIDLSKDIPAQPPGCPPLRRVPVSWALMWTTSRIYGPQWLTFP